MRMLKNEKWNLPPPFRRRQWKAEIDHRESEIIRHILIYKWCELNKCNELITFHLLPQPAMQRIPFHSVCYAARNQTKCCSFTFTLFGNTASPNKYKPNAVAMYTMYMSDNSKLYSIYLLFGGWANAWGGVWNVVVENESIVRMHIILKCELNHIFLAIISLICSRCRLLAVVVVSLCHWHDWTVGGFQIAWMNNTDE